MTLPDTLSHEVAPVERETLWVTDAELIRRVGAPRDKLRVAIRGWDRNPASGFPQKQPLFGGRRYWPAVKAFFDRVYGPKMGPSIPTRRKSP